MPVKCPYYHYLNVKIVAIFYIIFLCRTVSNIFSSLLPKFYEATKDYLWWYSREEVDETMPEKFKILYPKTRVIIDASEIKIECPSSVDAAILCYSSYKSNHTAKFLIGMFLMPFSNRAKHYFSNLP